MKRLFKKTKGLIKGTSSAVLLSAVIHLILLAIAGGLVVFTVIQKSEKKFVPPPPVERPKMNLIKPKVRMKNPPRTGSASRIVSKTPASMPDMQLPALEGMGEGLGTGIGGFELMPNLSEMSLFGGTKSTAIGNDFEGTLYTLNLDRRGNEVRMGDDVENELVQQFIVRGCNPMVFASYGRAPQKLYTTHFTIPPVSTEWALQQFGIDMGAKIVPTYWAAHYKGRIARKGGGRYRFWGFADNFMVVCINKKVVLICGFRAGDTPASDLWRSESKESLRYLMGHGVATVGDWFELEPGVPVQMDVLIGEYGGQWSGYMLSVEDATADYPRNRDGLPVLPIFKTDDLPERLMNKIKYLLIRDEVVLDDPLKFNVY